MKLAAALVCRNEITRFLEPCVSHLAEFVDEIIVLDDSSDDGTGEWLAEHANDRLIVYREARPSFFAHEGRLRQVLLDRVLSRSQEFVLSLDMDELVSDGAALRAQIEADPAQDVWSLEMAEVWNAAREHLDIRVDGGWRPHQLSLVWKAPPHGERYRMLDRKLACRRVPMQVLSQRAKPSGVDCLHFGWTDKATRQARYDRYVRHDNGKFHASAHLRSIMWSDARVQLQQRPWPEGEVFDSLRERFAGVTP